MNTGGDTPAPVTLAELDEQLRSPYALEAIGLDALPLVVASVPATDAVSADTDRFVERLRSARAVTVAVCLEAPTPVSADLLSAFDIVLAHPEHAHEALVPCTDVDRDLATLAGAVAANPRASVALVELLRLGTYAEVAQGLVAESLTYSMLQTGPEFEAWLETRGPAALPADEHPPVQVRRMGTALEVTLDRPHRANAFTASMRDHLVEALQLAAADAQIEGVILRGAGASFSSGGDLAEFGSAPSAAIGHETRLLRSPAWWMHHLARSVRVHLHGACIGAGIEVPAFAGTVLAAPDTVIRLPEVAMGLVPGAGGTVSLPRRIGPMRTAYLAITGSELTATDALAWGLVDRIA